MILDNVTSSRTYPRHQMVELRAESPQGIVRCQWQLQLGMQMQKRVALIIRQKTSTSVCLISNQLPHQQTGRDLQMQIVMPPPTTIRYMAVLVQPCTEMSTRVGCSRGTMPQP
jgi:hypothetical protein